MARNKKPTPKSQKEISNNLVNPYINPETGETRGNPNIPSEFDQFDKNDQTGIDFNRSEKLTFRGDTVKPFTLGLQDIDEAIHYYFNTVIKPVVVQNGNKIKVPIIYGSPERWKSSQIDGFYKDKNGKIMAPLIMFKRESMTNNRSITIKLDANLPHLYTSWQKVFYNNDSYSNFNVLNNKKPSKQFIANVIPDYVTITYKCAIQTYYVDQLNKIVEAINYASDSYWGDPSRFKFKAKIDTFSTVTENTQNQDRLVKSEFTLQINGYIVPDSIQKEINSIKKFNDKSTLVIGIETTSSPMETTTVSNNKGPSVVYPTPPTPPPSSSGVSNDTITYLNTNKQLTGSYLNSTTITFASGWLLAPTGLPPTNIDQFTLFCNGVLIEKTAILSFSELLGITTLIINPVELGYEFSNSDEVVAIGKFSA
jgi:hypothetical protein